MFFNDSSTACLLRQQCMPFLVCSSTPSLIHQKSGSRSLSSPEVSLWLPTCCGGPKNVPNRPPVPFFSPPKPTKYLDASKCAPISALEIVLGAKMEPQNRPPWRTQRKKFGPASPYLLFPAFPSPGLPSSSDFRLPNSLWGVKVGSRAVLHGRIWSKRFGTPSAHDFFPSGLVSTYKLGFPKPSWTVLVFNGLGLSVC